jgi:hypothetical protein
MPRPFGTLRDQFSNWLGSDQNRAVIASIALAHGIPHKGDKLLYKHYSNRPWAHLFEAQKRIPPGSPANIRRSYFTSLLTIM